MVGQLLVSVPGVWGDSVGAPSRRLETHSLKSPFQAADTSLRVLLPTEVEKDRRYPVLFILPVHEDGQFKHGDGLAELQKLNVPNQYQVICVSPAFTSEPWYADHDLDSNKRDESHLLLTVIPFVEVHYPIMTEGSGRYLLGFSKSGRGAISLLLRHPDKFLRAAAWDPGIRIDVGPFGQGYNLEAHIRERFGTRENFENYRLSNLCRLSNDSFGRKARLFYFNCEGVIRTMGGVRLHALMVESGIPHRYVMESRRAHQWGSGWMPEAISFLFETNQD